LQNNIKLAGSDLRIKFQSFLNAFKNYRTVKENNFSGIVTSIVFSGTNTRYKIQIKDTILECSVQSVGKKEISKNDKVFIHLPKEKIWAMNNE